MEDTRLVLPVAESLRFLMLDAEWRGDVQLGGFKNFYAVMGRMPYSTPRSPFPPIMGAAASTWAFTNGGRTSLLDGTFDLDTDTFKCALFLSTSDIGAASTTYAGVSNQVANGAGYTTGGIAITLTLAGTTTVTVDIATDPVWTASGGPITARFGVIYEVSGDVLCWCTLDSTPADVTATDGNTLTVAANASGVFTLA